MSRYHLVPRDDSLETDREGLEHLIPSPSSGSLNLSPRQRNPRSCSLDVYPSVILRAVSNVFALTGMLVTLLHTPGSGSKIACIVFFNLILATNILKLLSILISGVGNSFINISVYYKGTDVLAMPPCTTKRPSFVSILDLSWSIGLLVSIITIHTDTWNYWWSHSGAIGATVMGAITVFLQVLIAIPIIDRMGLTIRGTLGSQQQAIYLDTESQPHVINKDRKETVMTGAIEAHEEVDLYQTSPQIQPEPNSQSPTSTPLPPSPQPLTQQNVEAASLL